MSKMINEDRLFANVMKHLGKKDYMVEELVENARRAKATKVEFKTEGTVLTVTNNGQELDDFKSLLVVAESDYDKDICKTENPAGMGVYMILSTCVEATFESGNKKLNIDVKKLFDDREYRESILDHVETVDHVEPGFKLTMDMGENIAIVSELMKTKAREESRQRLANYIDIDIIVNGEEVQKKNIELIVESAGEGRLKGMTIGLPKKFGEHNSYYNGNVRAGHIYWHGKEIEVKGLFPFVAIIHDNHLFTPVLPDRQEVSNTEKEIADISLSIEKQLQKDIQKYFDTETIEDFFERKQALVMALRLSYNTDGITMWASVKKEEVEEIENSSILERDIFSMNQVDVHILIDGEDERTYVDEVGAMSGILKDNGIFLCGEMYFTNKAGDDVPHPKWWKDRYISFEDDYAFDVYIHTNKEYEAVSNKNYNFNIAEKIVIDIEDKENGVKFEKEISSLGTLDGDVTLYTSSFDFSAKYASVPDADVFVTEVSEWLESYSPDELSNILREEINTTQKALGKSVAVDEILLSLKTLLEAEGKRTDVKSFCYEKGEEGQYTVIVKTGDGEEVEYISSEANIL